MFMERRGIFTNPPKRGEPTTPGILFSAITTNFKKGDYVKPQVQKRSRTAEKSADERFAFKPASLLLDAPFQTDKEVYGEENKMITELVERSLEVIREAFFSILKFNIF